MTRQIEDVIADKSPGVVEDNGRDAPPRQFRRAAEMDKLGITD
jgi:hypothetical protein